MAKIDEFTVVEAEGAFRRARWLAIDIVKHDGDPGEAVGHLLRAARLADRIIELGGRVPY